MAILETEKLQLEKQHEEDIEKVQLSAFRLERFIGSDSDFRFYAGFPNYSSFKAFYGYLSPACEHLMYHGSNTAPITSESQIKCGKQRSDLCPQNRNYSLYLQDYVWGYFCKILLIDLISHQAVFLVFLGFPFLHQCLCALSIWPSRKLIQ